MIVKTREHWLKVAKIANPPIPKDQRDAIIDYCVANPDAGLWHATWAVSAQTYPCPCAPCALARGEKLSCL